MRAAIDALAEAQTLHLELHSSNSSNKVPWDIRLCMIALAAHCQRPRPDFSVAKKACHCG